MTTKNRYYDAIIIGAGAAGMMCALQAGSRGKSVLIIEHTNKVGEKIRISGGGKCNFTNLNISSENFISQNQHFSLSALARFSQFDFISLVESSGIEYHEKTLGQLFCNGSASQIISMFDENLKQVGVSIQLNTSVQSIRKTDRFEIVLEDTTIEATSLIIACGGKSVPKIGASNFGYLVAKTFGINIIETRPALVPLTFEKSDLNLTNPLSGISVNATVSCKNTDFNEGFLFTHRGVSGPSVLQISSYWKEGEWIKINLCPNINIYEELSRLRSNLGKKNIHTVLSEFLPTRLSETLISKIGLSGNLGDQSKLSLQSLATLIHNWALKPSGSEGYRTAEVTLGGIDTAELDSKTMESHKVKGLYFIGEVVDVTGWLGGYNFQWAWSSGWVAGNEL